MYGNNPKVIAFLIGLIFSMATFTGAVSAVNCNVDLGGNIPAVTAETSINYAIIETNNDPSYNAEKLVKNKRSPTNKRSKDPTDYHFKKQKQGIENLRTISTGGVPPKRPGEIIMYNIPRLMSMMSTVKTKITYNFSKFYKKLK